MGLFDFLFKKRPEPKGTEDSFRLLTGTTAHFSRWGGDIYESEIVRASIHARATHISKLRVETFGAAKPALQNKLAHGPNQLQTWSQFLYRLDTLLDIHNTAFICPVWDEYGEISGIYAPLPNRCEVVGYRDVPYLRYEFSDGRRASVELEYCGIMTKFQYKDDFFGEKNTALTPTMELINIQDQGISQGVKNAANYRFMAQLTNFLNDEDIANERKRFSEKNFAADGGGLLLFPNTYTNIKQVDQKPWIVDADQMKQIKDDVYSYFGVNDDILQNKFSPETWSAFYEAVIEPFAIQFSEVMTRMLFTFREQSQGNRVTATANRIQYMSNADKLNVSAQMADRGLMTRNEIREIWNLPPLPAPYGDQLPVRGEYYNIGDDEGQSNEEGNPSV